MRNRPFVLSLLIITVCIGCTSVSGRHNAVSPKQTTSGEAQWIRNGEPLEFEGELWYPADGVESLLAQEVLWAGEYREVPFFIDKIDVRPYDRLYTNFEKNMYRYFLKR